MSAFACSSTVEILADLQSFSGLWETPDSGNLDLATIIDDPVSRKRVITLLENVPIKHTGQPEASTVSYLGSKEAHFITGQKFTPRSPSIGESA